MSTTTEVPYHSYMTVESEAEWLQQCNDFCARLLDVNPGLTSAKIFPHVADPERQLEAAAPDAPVRVRIRRELFGLTAAFRFLERRVKAVPVCTDAVVRRIALAMDRQRDAVPPGATSEVLSAAYECVVLMRMTQAGFYGAFLDAGNGKRPDLVFPDAALLVECKDSQGMSGYNEDISKMALWARSQADYARTQLLTEDPSQNFEHIICLDLPENAFKVLAKDEEIRTNFFRQALSHPEDLNQFEARAQNIFFSSIDFNDQLPLSVGQINHPEYEGWWPQVIVGPAVTRAQQVHEAIYRTLGSKSDDAPDSW